MTTKQFVSGDEAVALGVRLVRPHVIAAYPITPQTIVVERLSDFVEEGSLNSQYLHVESEHSAMAASIGASAVGARTFTATSSQGLLYMAECLHYASGSRLPIVMMNANRAIATPWNIFGDQTDSMSQLSVGWIQLYAEDAQEALDMVIQAYKIAEDPEVLTPVMVNLDGFVLTHTYELVEIPAEKDVERFLPPFCTSNKMDFDDPKSLCITGGSDWYTEFRYQQHQAIGLAAAKIRQVDQDFADIFGRKHGGMVEAYRCEDAEVILVTLGSVCGTTRLVVDKMRSAGQRVGLLKLRCIRPFPHQEIRQICGQAKAIGVLEKDIDFGCEGAVFSDVNSAFSRLPAGPETLNFIAGLGGRSIAKEDIEGMFSALLSAERGQTKDPVRFVQLRSE
ncbi:MAG: transketolase C-terminal domain-containing protein [Negativicutes bacterium]|nr:transketolase C-terminal domain-containing protein [Negativicutes bacterium]